MPAPDLPEHKEYEMDPPKAEPGQKVIVGACACDNPTCQVMRIAIADGRVVDIDGKSYMAVDISAQKALWIAEGIIHQVRHQLAKGDAKL